MRRPTEYSDLEAADEAKFVWSFLWPALLIVGIVVAVIYELFLR